VTIESLLRGREILYIAKAAGCAACMAAETELQTFERAHPSMMILRIDANGPLPERLGLSVKATPTYAFRRDNDMIVRVGVLKSKEIERWLRSLKANL
jgi:hypothetical protein